jgi:hypothetical protein
MKAVDASQRMKIACFLLIQRSWSVLKQQALSKKARHHIKKACLDSSG